jgi:transposase
MASTTHHRNKKTGAIYRYAVESFWDKEKKAPRNKQVCLGRVDPVTGELIASKRRKKGAVGEQSEPSFSKITVRSRIVGPNLILDKITEEYGIKALLDTCFGKKANKMLSLVYFLVQKGVALSRVEQWSMATQHPVEQFISSQEVSELLRDISEDERQRFFSLWMERILEEDYLCYDITSISSYAKNNEYTQWGYNRDSESLEQINMAMLFGQNARLPAYYRRLPGNISDVATLKTTIKSLEFLGIPSMHFVLDRGFYSKANIDELYKHNHKFTIAVPAGRKWVEQVMDEHIESIASPGKYLSLSKDEALYADTTLYQWGENNHRLYVHVYYNAEQAAENYDSFTRKLITLKEELESGNTIDKHEPLYERYFIVTETPKRGRKVEYNDAEIQKYRNRYSGFFCIASNKIKRADEALQVYRNKDVVENCFDDLKNQLDMKRLRVHRSAAMDSRLFLQFIALIYISKIRQTTKGCKKLNHLSVRDTMEIMETLTQIKLSNRRKEIRSETSPLQREILNAFDVSLSA